eukprot:1135815-Rhodomonas_salina.1
MISTLRFALRSLIRHQVLLCLLLFLWAPVRAQNIVASCSGCIFILSSDGELSRDGQCADCKSLDLRDLGIQALDQHVFSSLQQLETLDLSDNNIEHIRGDQFKDCINLRWLKLSRNGIKQIDEGSLFGLSALEELEMEETSRPCTSTISDDFFRDLTSLRIVKMNGMGMQGTLRSALFRNLAGLVSFNAADNSFDVEDGAFAGLVLRCASSANPALLPLPW